MRFGSDSIAWEPSLTFVGTILNPAGNDELAIQHRLAQATKAFFKWKQILQCTSASRSCRVKLGITTFVGALLWLSETWNPTQAQRKRLNSWGARMFSRIALVKRDADESPIEHWRRLHRVGHQLLGRAGGSMNARRRGKLHSFAGHVARAQNSVASDALRTRSMSWWRQFQSTGAFSHPRRFRAWRWEQQLTAYYGEAETVFIDENVGWMEIAQNRDMWRMHRQKYMHSC